MKKKLLTLTLALCVCSIPLWAIVSGRSLTNTLKERLTATLLRFLYSVTARNQSLTILSQLASQFLYSIGIRNIERNV